MKKYMKPTMEGQMFVSNEYVAVCGSQTSYKFKCDAGATFNTNGAMISRVSGDLYDENWNSSDCYENYGWPIGWINNGNGFHACGEIHDSATTDSYILGWFDMDDKPNNGKNEIKVYIWQEIENGHVVNHHATTDIQSITSQINRS